MVVGLVRSAFPRCSCLGGWSYSVDMGRKERTRRATMSLWIRAFRTTRLKREKGIKIRTRDNDFDYRIYLL